MSTALGLAACAVSSLCFSSMYVALRNFSTGDGIFVQWVVCSSIFAIGLVVNAVQHFPPVQPLGMLGGVLWAIGNVTALPIIKAIGLGMGILIWGTVNCVVGWAVGRFGLLGIHADVPSSPFLNYLGLILVIVGGIMFSFVKPSVPQMEPSAQDPSERISLMRGEQSTQSVVQAPANEYEDVEADGESRSQSAMIRLLAIGLSALAGTCYGLTFVPVIYVQDHPETFPQAPREGIAYTLSHFSGIFLTSTAILLVYSVYKQNRPFINPETVLPAFFAGLLWATGQILWFYANDILSQAITFPINAMVPGVCAALWSVFYFQEIRGRDNLRLLAVAVAVTLCGAAFVGVSKALTIF